MKIKVKLGYRHAGFSASTALDPSKVYDAEPAINQPGWETRQCVFVDPGNGAPEILLEGGEYTSEDDKNEFCPVQDI